MNPLKFLWPYVLGAVPFIAAFIYQVFVVWPTRPSLPDRVNGYTVAMHVGERDVFISNLDLGLMMGAWGIGIVILIIGYRRMRRQQRQG